MSHAEKDALILKLFDWLEELEARLNKLENIVSKTVAIPASLHHQMA
jgi:hypothetical protein